MIHDGSDSALAEYDQVIKQVEAARQANPPGRVSHVAARKRDGHLVVDVRESQEAFDRFAHTRVPLLERAAASRRRSSTPSTTSSRGREAAAR